MSCIDKECDWVREGDLVRVIDGSWAIQITGGKLKNIHGIDMAEVYWRVVATGSKYNLPSEGEDMPPKFGKNDTIIYDGVWRTVFIRHQQLEPVDAKYIRCQNCGVRTRI